MYIRRFVHMYIPKTSVCFTEVSWRGVVCQCLRHALPASTGSNGDSGGSVTAEGALDRERPGELAEDEALQEGDIGPSGRMGAAAILHRSCLSERTWLRGNFLEASGLAESEMLCRANFLSSARRDQPCARRAHRFRAGALRLTWDDEWAIAGATASRVVSEETRNRIGSRFRFAVEKNPFFFVLCVLGSRFAAGVAPSFSLFVGDFALRRESAALLSSWRSSLASLECTPCRLSHRSYGSLHLVKYVESVC